MLFQNLNAGITMEFMQNAESRLLRGTVPRKFIKYGVARKRTTLRCLLRGPTLVR